MGKVSANLHIDADMERAVANEYREKLQVKCPTVEQDAGNLSGGNQQKVLLSKWMFAEPEILILDEPTRGVDVGARYAIYEIINDLAAEGKSVLFISSEMPELLGMCDRIYVMSEGRMVAELSRDEASQEVIMASILQSGKGA
jgi:putative multiple sugar transport system ATP-binding protein